MALHSRNAAVGGRHMRSGMRHLGSRPDGVGVRVLDVHYAAAALPAAFVCRCADAGCAHVCAALCAAALRRAGIGAAC